MLTRALPTAVIAHMCHLVEDNASRITIPQKERGRSALIGVKFNAEQIAESTTSFGHLPPPGRN